MEKEAVILTIEMLVVKNDALSKALSMAIDELNRKQASHFLIGHLRDTLKENKVEHL